MAMKEKLTVKQQKLLDFYLDKGNWRPPTLKQMREYMGYLSDESVLGKLRILKRKGFICK